MKGARSFAARLTGLITALTAAAIMLVSAVYVTAEYLRVRAHGLESTKSTARILAADLAATLDFDDPAAARESLQALSAVREYAAAAVRRAGDASTGDPAAFAEYRRQSDESLPAFQSATRSGIEGRWLTFVQPIVRADQQIGELRLLYDFALLRQQLIRDLIGALVVATIATGLAYLGAQAVQRALLRPVRELSEAAATIASREDYSVRARKVSGDELGDLTDVFNTMVERLGEAESLKRNHMEMLEREVAKRAAEVLETQSRLRQSERMASLGTLSAGLGHDIGNILLPLRSHLSAIRERAVGADERDFAAIARATDYLQNLSTSLRMLAQDPGAGSGRGPTSLASWWREMEPILRAMLGRSIALEHDVADELPAVAVSKPLLMQAVFNLVQNAGQALTPESGTPKAGGWIRVRARLAGPTRVAISVEDNGPGMTDEVRRRCMEPYFTTKTRRISSGLGLALVKGIVEGAGGELLVESAVGEGARFTLTVPVAPTATGDNGAAVVRVNDARRRALVSLVLQSLQCKVSHQPDPPAGSPRDLWITDTPDTVPPDWAGRVVLMNDDPGAAMQTVRAPTLINPRAQLPELRGTLRDLLSGTSP